MTFNINSFASKINGTGLAKNNLFVAAIKSPSTLPIENDLLFLCKAASIPGMEISTTPIQPQGWGKSEQRPTEYRKSNLTLIFMVDSNFAVKQYFHRWFQTIVNYNDLGGAESEDPAGKLPYEFAYKKEYTGVVDVVVYANNDNSETAKTYTYHFEGVYPVSIGSIESAWENQSEIMLMTVSFAFDSMTVSGMYETEVSMRSTSPAETTTSFGGAISTVAQQVFGNTNLPEPIQDIVNRISSPLNNSLNSINTIRRTTTNFVSTLRRIF